MKTLNLVVVVSMSMMFLSGCAVNPCGTSAFGKSNPSILLVDHAEQDAAALQAAQTKTQKNSNSFDLK